MKRGKPFKAGQRVVDNAGLLWIVVADANWRRVVCKSAETEGATGIFRRNELTPATQKQTLRGTDRTARLQDEGGAK
jgi:hypothetical protein